MNADIEGAGLAYFEQADPALPVRNFGFGTALVHLKIGNMVCRKGWNGKGMYLQIQIPDENSKMTLPYIYMFTAQGDLVPWLASQTDMLTDDWEVFV